MSNSQHYYRNRLAREPEYFKRQWEKQKLHYQKYKKQKNLMNLLIKMVNSVVFCRHCRKLIVTRDERHSFLPKNIKRHIIEFHSH